MRKTEKILKYAYIIFFAIVFVLGAGACSRLAQPTQQRATATPIPTPSLPSAIAKTTPTPARQSLPTPTAVPMPTPWIFPTPFWDNTSNKWPYGVVEPAIPIEPTFGGPIKVYVVLGSDWMPHRDQDLTDSVMLVLVNTETHSATVVSLARDLYVFIPGFGWGRINQPWSLGGFDTVKETIRFNFGLEVDGVVYARIRAVQNFIDDALGGVFVQVENPIVERCGDIEISLVPGEVYMDGEYAICYARSRMMTSDTSRMVRQQEIISAMRVRFFERAMNHPIGMAEDLYETFIYLGFKTDISIFDVPALVGLATDVDENVDFTVIAQPFVEHFDHPETGAWLLYLPTQAETYEFFMEIAESGLDEL